MSEPLTEKLNFLKEQSKFFFKLKNDKKFCIQEINKLKDDKNKLSELIKKYEGNLTGSVNIARYVLLQKLKCGENIEDNILDILDEKYKSSDKDFWKDYIPENVINEKIANYNKNKPYQNWGLFGICHVFFYHGELEIKVNEYLEDLSKRMLNDLNLENKKYSCETTDFVGSNHYGSEFLFIRFKPEFGSNQLSFVISNGEMCVFSKKNKEGQKDEAEWYRKKSQQKLFKNLNSYNEIIEKLQTIRDEVLKANESNENGENTEMLEDNDKKIPLNQILYGPPGTGKTYNTVIKAMEIINCKEYSDDEKGDYNSIKTKFNKYKEQGRIEFITFHQSYSYEEFVEGIKPAITKNKDITYEVKDGIFKKISVNALSNDKAKSYLEKEGDINLKQDKEEKIPYVLIIDEINRGNISKIFGELITLLEEDKRLGAEHELTVKLPYSQNDFGIPNNLYIIGTMNTSDRSIASVDIALRRRFTFKEMMPEPKLLKDENVKIKENSEINLKELLETLNKRITVLLDRDHQIGHSYFMNVKKDVNKLKKVWFNSVIPLLNEYFYDDWEKLKMLLGDKNGETPFITKIDAKFKYKSDEDCKQFYDFAKELDIPTFTKALNNIYNNDNRSEDVNAKTTEEKQDGNA